MQVPEGPGAWGVLQREEERLRRKGRALRAHELPKGIDKLEFLESSVQNDKNKPQKARRVGMANMTLRERWEWVRQERKRHLKEQREATAKLAEAVIKLEIEEVSPDIAF